MTGLDCVNDAFTGLPQVPWFTLTSSDIVDGEPLPPRQLSAMFGFGLAGGRDESPELSWSGAPRNTKSYAVTVYDPDAPTGAGFWHWAVANIPASVTSLPSNAGDISGQLLPHPAFQLRNDAGVAQFVGGAGSVGGIEHRYFFVVHALDVKKIDVTPEASPSYLGLRMVSHILGRAVLVATAQTALGIFPLYLGR